MKTYDFSKGKRGAVRTPIPEPAGKVKITIRLDADLVDHYMAAADASGGSVGYQTLINEALRQQLTAPSIEATVRSAVHDEFEKRAAAYPLVGVQER